MNASRSSVQNESKQSENDFSLSETPLSLDESVLQLIDHPLSANVNVSNLRTDAKYKGFDSTMGDKYIYPTNYTMRQYQYHISRVSLFKNTLVVLPTGLGKTFIASVVMYNFFRWYPKGKIIFMAPTRPLVAQQIQACYQVMGFPKDETIELTGKQNKKIRAVAWREKRVFYCTPQVVWRDICDNEMNFPIDDIKLVVVDEAHKAKGKYAYTEVVQAIWERNKLFRVLALSATPGRNMNDVSEVVQNLLISHIEVRRENSIDVVPYVFKKNIKTVVVKLNEKLTQIRQRLYDLVEPYMQNLEKHKVITGQGSNMSKAWLLFDRNKFRMDTVSNRHPDQSQINADFSVCISMFHAIELLERHGMRVFLNYFSDNTTGNTDAAGSIIEEKFFVLKDPKIKQFITEVRQECGIVPFTDADMSLSFHGNISDVDIEEPIDYGHPKFDILQDCLLAHFREHSDTKAIVFCEYRESVFLINRMLLVNRPLIKPKVFVGQGSSHNRTITQKEQIAIMNDFRSGKCNTLVATSVAEEGIDVGEVDFIVCFDQSNKNPIRFVQRIGRTGRKRQGKVTMLVSEGKEHKILRDILATKDGINMKIAKSNEIKNVLYKECPRLVPPEYNPQCQETFIELPITQAEPSTSKKKATKNAKTKDGKKPAKSSKKQAAVQKGGIRKFFKPIDAEIEEDFDLSDEPSYSTAGNTTADHCNHQLQSTLEEDEQTEIPIHDAENHQTSTVSLTQSELDSDVRLHLKLKLEQLYQRYCEAKKRQAKWNELDERVIKPSKQKEKEKRIPSPIAEMLKQFKTNTDNWSNRSLDEKLGVMMLMSYLRLPEERSSMMVKKNIKSEAVDQSFSDTQLSFVNTQAEYESKYASQLKQSPNRMAPTAQILASSTPHKPLNSHQKQATPIHSPIVGISRINPVEHKSHQKTRINKDDPKWYLKYLGLNSISDLFSDDDDENGDEPMHTSDGKQSDDPATQLCNNLNKSICGNESLVEEKSQYTVSRILKICEDAERERGGEKKANSDLVTPKRKRLYIGSVDDLFRDDDDDDDFGIGDDDNGDGGVDDLHGIINSQVVDVALSTSSNDTIDYDIDDAMLQHKNAHHSTNLFKDSIEGEASHNILPNTVAKSVANTKSDELFSTYNETVANSSKATANCTKNSVFGNQSPQREYNLADESIPATPPKSNNTNFFAYFSRSPSVLFKASSILSTNHHSSGRLTNKTNDSSKSNNSIHSDKSPTSLSFKLSALNSQLTMSKHFDDFDDELKENFDIETNASPFATCQTSRTTDRYRQRSNSPDPSPDAFATCPSIPKINKKSRGKPTKAKKRRKNHFIDDEAAVSGDDESSEDDFATQGIFNITEADEDDDPSVDMQAKYLQSVKSPIGQQRFRIGYRNTMATQDIFSQFVAPDQSKYEEDSFVVGSDEEVDSDCTAYSSGNESSEFDEITIAETRPNKRKLDENKTAEVKKRRRIIQLSSDSDD